VRLLQRMERRINQRLTRLFKTYTMKNSKLHIRINLRAQMLKALTIERINQYGKDSATVNSKYVKSNTGKMVNKLLYQLK